MGKSSTNTTTTTATPNPIVQGAAQDIATRASNAINTLTPEQLVPNATPAMQGAWTLTNNLTGNGDPTQTAAWPYLNRAGGMYDWATQPLYNTVGAYESPYIRDVVNATQQQFDYDNAIQQQGIIGNAVAKGAWGGDRSAVAQALTAYGQQKAQAPVIAGLYNQGFNTALGANEAQNWQALQAAQGLQGLGTGILSTGLGAAGALYGIGQQQYGLQQAQNTIPLQIPQYEAGLLGTVAGTLGGTSSTTSPAASPISQIAGLGIGGIGLLGATGAFGDSGYLTNLFGSSGGDYGNNLERGGVVGHYGPGGRVFGINAPNNFAFNSADPFDFAGAPIPRPSPSGSNPLAPLPTVTQKQESGGGLGFLGDIIGIGSKIAPFFLNRGGIVGYDDGGTVSDDDFTHPRSGFTPGMFARPMLRPAGGFGIPKPPQGIAPGQNPPGGADLSMAGLGKAFSSLKDSGIFGSKDKAYSGDLDRDSGNYAHGGGIFVIPPANTGAVTADGGLLDARLGPDDDWSMPGYADAGVVGDGWLEPLPGRRYGSGLSAPRETIVFPDVYKNLGIPRYDDGGEVATALIPPQIPLIPPPVPDIPVRDVTVGDGNGIEYTPPARLSNGIVVSEASAPINGAGAPRASVSAKEMPWEQAWPLIQKYESMGGQNIPNYRYDATHTAQGYGQITNTNWRNIGPTVGVDLEKYPNAMAAPKEVQERVAKALFDADRERGGTGFGDWAPYNDKLAAALGLNGGSPQLASAGQSRGIAPMTAADAGGGDAPSVGAGIAPSAVPRASSLTASDLDKLLQASRPNPWMALAAAGFGMAAGRSPQALQNIGAGALEGVKAYEAQRLAQPKLAGEAAEAILKGVQARKQLNAIDVFQNANSTPAQRADAIEGLVKGAQSTIGKEPNAVAVASPSGGSTTVPLPAQGAASAPSSAPSGTNLPPAPPAIIATDSADVQQTKRALALEYSLIPSANDLAAATSTYIGHLQALPGFRGAVAATEAQARLPAQVEEARQKAAIELQNAAPMERARVGERPEKYIGADGRERIAPLRDIAAGTAPGMAPPTAGLIDPRTGQAAPGSTGISGPVVALERGEAAERTGQGEEANKERTAINTAAAAARDQYPILNSLSENAKRFYTGPMNELVAEFNRFANVVNPERYGETVAARENFIKDQGVFTREATKSVSPRAGIQEVQFIQKSLPSPDNSERGIQQVVNEFKGLNDYKVAKAQALQTWMASNGGLARGFEDYWNANAPVTPYAYVVARMDPQLRQSLIAELNKTAEGRMYRQRLQNEILYAQQHNLTGLQ